MVSLSTPQLRATHSTHHCVPTETLFSIFYQSPRDIKQEMAATELSARDWRWHKVLRQWLQKDTREVNSASALPVLDLTHGAAPIGAPPLRVDDHTERGVYVFFDAANWRRERREFILDYDQLDHRAVAGALANGGGAADLLAAPAPSAFGGASAMARVGAVGMTGSGAVANAQGLSAS